MDAQALTTPVFTSEGYLKPSEVTTEDQQRLQNPGDALQLLSRVAHDARVASDEQNVDQRQDGSSSRTEAGDVNGPSLLGEIKVSLDVLRELLSRWVFYAKRWYVQSHVLIRLFPGIVKTFTYIFRLRIKMSLIQPNFFRLHSASRYCYL